MKENLPFLDANFFTLKEKDQVETKSMIIPRFGLNKTWRGGCLILLCLFQENKLTDSNIVSECIQISFCKAIHKQKKKYNPVSYQNKKVPR